MFVGHALRLLVEEETARKRIIFDAAIASSALQKHDDLFKQFASFNGAENQKFGNSFDDGADHLQNADASDAENGEDDDDDSNYNPYMLPRRKKPAATTSSSSPKAVARRFHRLDEMA